MPDATVTTHQLAELLRVSYRQLDYWVRIGFLPIAEAAPGSGIVRHWSPEEIGRARVFAALVHAGVSPVAVAESLPSALIGLRNFRIDLGELVVIGRL